MTRAEAKNFLITLGIEEPSDEQVSNYLNQVNGETKKEKDRADKLKTEADRAAELQAELDKINEANMTEMEKANKEKQTAIDSLAKLQAEMKVMSLKASLAEKGLSGENVAKLIDSFGKGELDIEVLATIISEKETAAAIAKEKEIAANSNNPGGSNGGGGEEKSEAEKVAEMISKSKAADKTEEILANYM